MNNFYNSYLYNSARNSFIGYYVNDYTEVLNTAVPTNGEATIFADLEKNMIWSKKLIGNTPCVQAYRITPIYQDGQKPQTQIIDSSDILAEVKAIKAEIAILKGEHNESK